MKNKKVKKIDKKVAKNQKKIYFNISLQNCYFKAFYLLFKFVIA